MQAAQKPPLILTLRIDQETQAFFNRLRQLYFPPERNFIQAHLTMFHQLPNELATVSYLRSLKHNSFVMEASQLRYLGQGVAYAIESSQLKTLRTEIVNHFKSDLIKQDMQGFKPHITIQNKVSAGQSKSLFDLLSAQFQPFSVHALGLDLWSYLGGPWRHEQYFSFLE